jgi:hypothetical protein
MQADWVIAAAVIVAAVAVRATGDAHEYRHFNCWFLESRGNVDVQACAPGSQPRQFARYSSLTQSGAARSCELVREADAGVKVWRCVPRISRPRRLRAPRRGKRESRRIRGVKTIVPVTLAELADLRPLTSTIQDAKRAAIQRKASRWPNHLEAEFAQHHRP